ncbi:MAG: hypothetical protein N4A76_04405 [Firmicutes bacterium]|jgi:hypothetical protein|nr:hypothetical protein [Bacillota bacterium]
MKIKIVNHKQDEQKHMIEIRYEQETLIKNSVNCNVTLYKGETEHLSVDEIYTLAYHRTKSEMERVFRAVQYEEEELNPIQFKIIEAKAHKIELQGDTHIVKEKRKKQENKLQAVVKDQYNKHYSTGLLSLAENQKGVELIEDKLHIKSDKVDQIKVKMIHDDIEDEVVLGVNRVQSSKGMFARIKDRLIK